ncbi:glucose 1-dehydrogenase [Candidatus Cyanaurora vandensis]|uniref:glucose 1-dehydrogenase n=1 Tax=Candidatus Cyanaurora vandensis TaxID=2714958 RepID=UPI002579B430|nr:glucose 1-dehydrogenase [Candidatus Cyanaurora vandensis]
MKGQTALVTGASSGIGRAIALALGQAGAQVVVNYRSNAEKAQQVVTEIMDQGGKAIALAADVSQEEQVAQLFAETIRQFDSLELLVSNAGVQQDAKLVDMTLAQWETVLASNLTGAFLCTRAAAREFLRQGPRPESRALGKIIFISSVHTVIPWAGHCNYAASKAGLDMFMKSVAQELAPQGIRVNSVAPGAIKTPINEEAWSTPEAEAELLKLIPSGRVGVGADVAQAVVWLASEAADYVQGTILYVDGGMTLYPEFAKGG